MPDSADSIQLGVPYAVDCDPRDQRRHFRTWASREMDRCLSTGEI
ncbi:hypothetical protein [Micromonospora sp. MH33]|nr:hypothetical protein [Micromonospora sp. MH33]